MENNLNKVISGRIIDLMRMKNLTRYAILKEIKIPKASFYKCIENKSEWKVEHLIEIAKYFGVNLNWLLSGKEAKSIVRENGIRYAADEDVLYNNIQEFPVLAEIPAGKGEISYHDWPEYINISLDKNEHFALRVDTQNGFSMTPFIEPGDIIFCSLTKKIKDGDIVITKYKGNNGAIKRIFMSEQIFLLSLNPVEPPIIISKKDLQQVFKVVLIWKKK